MKKRAFTISAVLLSLLIAGCIGSGTVRLEYEIDEFVSSSDGLIVREINLADNEDYDDNKDKIKSVDQVTVVGWMVNLEPVDNFAEIWIADVGTYSTPAEVRANATRVFISPVISGNDSLFIDWSDGLAHIENIPTLKDAAEAGHFWLYGLAAESPFTVRFRIGLVIILTVGL